MAYCNLYSNILRLFSFSNKPGIHRLVIHIIIIYSMLNKISKIKGRGPGINSSQSKNVGKIQLSMQLSHLSIILENSWF